MSVAKRVSNQNVAALNKIVEIIYLKNKKWIKRIQEWILRKIFVNQNKLFRPLITSISYTFQGKGFKVLS